MPNDLTQFDGAMLTWLECEGSTPRTELVAETAELVEIPGFPVPGSEEVAEQWLIGAERRGLMRVDDDDQGLVAILTEGRGRLVELL